ncbi:MAG: DNA polymerase III subunit delta [Treponema sp.]|nr:DNA polymerase III subunit delta [Treponema sp.]MBQ7619804.1 DNA polymerase III subunit delta [Treponema sp.]
MSAPIYLFSGPEIGERSEAVAAVKKSLNDKFGSLESYTYYSVETDPQSALVQLYSESLFSAATCVVYNGAETIKKKEDIDKIAAWLNGAGEASVLILVSDEISCDSKLEKLVPKENRKQFWEMFEDRKIPWLKNYFSKNGFSIDDDACEEILDLVENNTQALKSECSRFFAVFEPGAKITVQNVDQLIEHNREESAFTLFDAMAQNAKSVPERLETALGILQKIRLSKDSSSVPLIAGLAYCFRRLEAWHNLRRAGKTDDFSLKTNGFASKKSRTQFEGASRCWTLGQTVAIKALLARVDMQIRSSGGGMEDTLLQTMIYSIVAKKGASLAVWEEGWPA